jgi:hypothetical protein
MSLYYNQKNRGGTRNNSFSTRSIKSRKINVAENININEVTTIENENKLESEKSRKELTKIKECENHEQVTIQEKNSKIEFKDNLEDYNYNDNSILEVIRDWGVHSSAHGIPSISRKSSMIAKIIWVVILTTSWAYLGYLITSSLIEYFKYEADESVEIITERPTTFPVVDICNLSPYKTILNETYQNIMKNNLTIDYFNPNPNTAIKSYLSKKDEADVFIKEVLLDYENRASKNEIDLKSMGYKWSDLLLNCKYDGIDCTDDDFTYFHKFDFRFSWNNIFIFIYFIFIFFF